MTLLEKANQYDMEVDELSDVLMSDPKNEHFFKQHDIMGNHPLDPLCERAIDEIMSKRQAAESQIDADTDTDSISEETMTAPNTDQPENASIESQATEEKPKAKRAKKKGAPAGEVTSEIDNAPNTVLRKFYAENFNVKPEKIFLMDDASVKEKVDEKYIVLERESDFLFIKRTSAVVSIAK